MAWQAWTTLGILSTVLGLLIFTRYAPHLILLAGLVLLFSLGIIDENDVLAGAANPGMVTVGVLYIVVAGLRLTGAMNFIAAQLLGTPKSEVTAQARIMTPVAFLSAFMNNTPIVAVMMPIVNDWSRKIKIASSKLLIPLSFASILGGMCTLIGTSTILVVNGLVIDHADPKTMAIDPNLSTELKAAVIHTSEMLPKDGLGMFDISLIGLPLAVTGLVYLLIVGRKLLPQSDSAVGTPEDVRQYTVEMVVAPDGPLVSKTVEDAGLRHLPGLYLIEINRGDQVLPAVSPNVVLEANDRLIFIGVVESVVDLQKIRGLIAADDQIHKIDEPRPNRCLVEAVVSDTCPVVGRTIRQGRFRTRYNAAVIAVARNGEKILNRKIGNIELQAGDTLLLEARASFAEQHRNSSDFYLVSSVDDSSPTRHERASIALIILAAMVAVVSLGFMTMLQAAMLAAALMIVTGCCSAAAAFRQIDWQLLLIITASLGIGRAMDRSGAATAIADSLLTAIATSPHLALAVILIITMIFTNLINAKAAAVLMFPIAIVTAARMGLDPMPFVIAIMVAAAASFATPMGYQTNLMVYGPGGYKFTDYLKIGIPLSIIIAGLSIFLIPLIWPFG